jgi:hypothetical protein
MTSPNVILAGPVLVAIDIAKVRNEVLIEAPSHKRRRRLPVLNTRAEHDRLIEILQTYSRPVVCGLVWPISMPQLEQLTMDSRLSPQRVGEAHLADQWRISNATVGRP